MTSFLPRLVGVGSVKFIRGFQRFYSWDGSSYEGAGKTTVTILNKDPQYGLMIDKITTAGFQLNNNLWVLGPIILFPRSILGWNIASSNEITEDSLALFEVVEPTVDILVVGLDQKYDENNTPFIKIFKDFAKRKAMSIEILPIEHACTTFNFLNAESRFVGAILMPPKQQLPKNLKAIQDAAMRRQLQKPEKPKIESK